MASEFLDHLPTGIKLPLDPVGDRILREYGAVFVTTAAKPTAVIFRNEDDVTDFRSSVDIRSEPVNGITVELQAAAFSAYLDAVASAEAEGLAITPRGEDASGRSYLDTVALWKSRVQPGLDHWITEEKLSETEAERIRSLAPFDQVAVVFELESRGLYFAKDLSKSIIYSVAPPGTSQHLSLLALDVAEHDDERVREIMAQTGWYQTVVSDLPHFTYLGHSSERLSSLRLRQVEHSGREYWLPAI